MDVGTIPNGCCGGAVAACRRLAGETESANAEIAEAAPSPAIISRRLSNLLRKHLRRLKVVAAELLRAPFFRWTTRSQLAVNRKFLFSLVAFTRAAERDRQIVVG